MRPYVSKAPSIPTEQISVFEEESPVRGSLIVIVVCIALLLAGLGWVIWQLGTVGGFYWPCQLVEPARECVPQWYNVALTGWRWVSVFFLGPVVLFGLVWGLVRMLAAGRRT